MHRLLIVSSLLDPKYGGPPSVVRLHVEALKGHLDVSLIGCAPRGSEIEVKSLFPGVHIFPETWPGRWFRGKGLRRALKERIGNYDVLHAHMLWDHSTWATWREAKRAGKPFIITPHGSLIADWRSRGLHKQLYSRLVLDRLLRDAAGIHALNQAEADACRVWGFSGRIFVVPNGLPVEEYDRVRDPALALARWPSLANRRIMLYLGRLWWQKGLDILPESWSLAYPGEEWILVLAGPDYRDYGAELAARIDALGLKERILFTGPVAGELKDSLLATSECFVLPSHGEGFSVAVLEAMAASLPCIVSSECHFPELAVRGGGWEIPLRKEALVDTIRHVCGRSSSKNRATGEKARTIGRTTFTIDHVTAGLTDAYRSIL
jgi:glycosyltransferase involved in cell wall biosynthesis